MAKPGDNSLGAPLLKGKEAHEFDGREPETLVSDFLPPPEPVPGLLQGLLYGAVAIGLTLGLLLPMCALLLIPLSIYALVRHVLNRRNAKWRRDPKDLRVAIIGGGWAGVQAMQRFRDYGCEQVKGFERNSTLGGVFGKDLRYAGLQLHSPLWICRFLNYPFERISERSGKIMDGKARADRVQRYIESFCTSNSSDNRWRLGAKVTKVMYDSATKEARITVRDVATGFETDQGPFDFVLFTGFSCKPKLPKGVTHEEILDAQKKVLIVGGAKSACDHCLMFFRAGYKNFNWVYRRTTLFVKYELLLHDRSLLNMLRGVTTIAAMMWYALSSKVGSVLLWCNRVHCTVDGVMHLQTDTFHLGLLCPTQRTHMMQLMPMHGKQGNPVKYTTKGLQLESGETVDADVMIWATGFDSAVEELVLERDGAVVPVLEEQPLYHHMILPQFPCIGNASTFFTTFGPMRGCSVAEYALHYCCVQNLALVRHLFGCFVMGYQGHMELGLLPPLPEALGREP